MQKLDDLLLFTEVVEHAGFSAAARNLGIQRSKLSRHIAELENRIGVRLFHRNTRNVVLTPAGEEVYIHAKALKQAAHNAFAVATDLAGDPKGVLRIGCSSTLAQEALMPILALFMSEYPKIRIIINTSDHNIDLISAQVDLVFRISSKPLDDSSLIIRPICDLPMVLVASQNYMEDKLPIKHPNELKALNFIALSTQKNTVCKEFVYLHNEIHAIQLEPYMSCGNMSVLKSAVKQDMGAAILPKYLCIHELKSGQFVEVFEPNTRWELHHSLINALIPTRQNILLATKLFLDFSIPLLREKLNKN
ncbi:MULTISPECIES: LysR family transcriptional regulator [Acinetobacter]|uniref:LysR family transcriptional regulator n=1 Tax=Acinetobacter TaxID=469 RepID=UPI00124E3425|nr:LysR substrate-binding domain-containing protein [Acinetobacter sp. TUM15071]MCH7382542.1 LysR substrate-binding domain-containing protein [Acinetobacter dispersus]MCH7392379.1 LysR substrate-binding domain-containing protein [Acinetobacter dispersus]